MAISTVGGALAGARPSGLLVADVLVPAGFALVVAAAAGRSRRWTWLVLAGGAAALAGGPVARIAANLALGVALLAVTGRRRSRLAGTVVGALAVQVLLRVDAGGALVPGFAGGSALVSGALTLPVLVSAYRLLGTAARARARAACVVGAAFVAGATLALAAALGSARSEAARGLDDVRAGLTLALSGDQRAAGTMADAALALAAARDRLAPWWAWPARLVPVLGHQAAAMDIAVGEAARLAATASTATAAADLAGLRVVDGALDLDRLAEVRSPLAAVTTALERAARRLEEIRSPWLLPPVRDRIDAVHRRARQAAVGAHTAAAVVDAVPGLLGVSGERRYVVAFVTPAESRGAGGYMGSFGEVTADGGRLTLTRAGRTLELMDAPVRPPRPIPGPAEYVTRYGRFKPEKSLGDIGYSPDFPTVAQVLEGEYERAGGVAVEGAVSVDPYALAALLELTGPVPVAGIDEPLTAANAAEVLLFQQYVRFPAVSERLDFLADATAAVLERLTEGPLPDFRRVIEVLGPVVRQGRLMVHSARGGEQAVLAAIGLDGSLPDPAGGDFLSVVTQNSANNKIDVFLHRAVAYRATFEPGTGRVDATVEVTLRNDAPAAGLPHYVIGSTDPTLPAGTNRMYLSVYTPHRLTAARLDGVPLAMESARELGRYVHSAFVTLGAGRQGVVRLQLSGQLDGGSYRIGYAPQPLVNPDTVQLAVEPASGWAVEPAGPFQPHGRGIVAPVASDRDQRFSASFRRAG